MTRTRYFIAYLLQNFGVVRKSKRLTDAAYEMHLMQDGEELLGAFCWPNIEGIEDLSHEYWNLRQLDRKKTQALEKVAKAEAFLASAQEKKVNLLNLSKGDDLPIVQIRNDLMTEIKSLAEKRDSMMTQALATKRKHGALKTKLQVLKDEGAEESLIQECLAKLADFRNVFMQEKEVLAKLADEISSKENKLASVQEKVGAALKGSENESNEAYSMISKANKDISAYQAELSAIQEQQIKLFREVGHFLNIQSNRSDCLKACQGQRVILNQVKLLLESIRRNRKLADRIGR